MYLLERRGIVIRERDQMLLLEAATLIAVLGEGHATEDVCYLGSVKTNKGYEQYEQRDAK
jgi:hypothetical protein